MSQDPTPGDPDLIEPIRVRYQNIGDAAEQARTILNKDGSITQGRGAAMESLKKQVGDELPDRLNKVATSYHEAAQAYQAYMPRLREAQEKFDQAVEAAQQAAPTANQTAPTLGAEPTDEEKAGADQKNAEIAAGQSALNSAKGIAEQAKQMRESAQRDLESVLDDAAGQAFKVSIFQKIKNFFDDFPFVQILLAILIAVVAVFFPIIGLILGAGLFLLNQVVASQTGGIKPGDFILGALSIIPGGSLLGAGGKGLQVAGRLLGKNANLFGKAPGAVSGSLNSIKNVSAINKTLNNPVVGNIVGIGGTFAKNFSAEVAGQGIDGAFNGQDAAGIAGVLAGGALGALGGRGGKGGKGGSPFPIPSKGSNRPPPGGTSRGLPPAGNSRGLPPAGNTSTPAPTASTSSSAPSTSNAAPSTSNAVPGPSGSALPVSLGPRTHADGTVDLNQHEGVGSGGGGHAIARHVNRTNKELDNRLKVHPPIGSNPPQATSSGGGAVRPQNINRRNRLNQSNPMGRGPKPQHKIVASSTFLNLKDAEAAASFNLTDNPKHAAVLQKVIAGEKGQKILLGPLPPGISGHTRVSEIRNNIPQLGHQDAIPTQVKTIIEHDATPNSGGFRIHTNYPEK